jgi:hypothetical protein
MAHREAHPALSRPSEGHVFIVAFGRSGSTLTQKLLNALPGYCIRGENANALANLCRTAILLRREPVYGQLRALELAGPGGQAEWQGRPIERRDWFANMGRPDHPWYGIEAVDATAFARDLFEVFARTVLRPPEGTRVAGCKEIRWATEPAIFHESLDLVSAAFPGTRFIFQNRDFEHVRRSSFWKEADAGAVKAMWDTHERLTAEYLARRDNGFRLDHRVFREGPDALGPLFSFLGEPFDRPLVETVLETRLTH